MNLHFINEGFFIHKIIVRNSSAKHFKDLIGIIKKID